MLLLGQGHVDDRFPDAGVEGHGQGEVVRAFGAQDLKGPLVQRRRHLHRDGLADTALAGEPIALADEAVAELELIHDRGGRDGPRDELHAAGRAATAAATGGRDVHAGAMRGLEDGHARLDVQRTLIGQDGEGDAHASVRIPLAARLLSGLCPCHDSPRRVGGLRAGIPVGR